MTIPTRERALLPFRSIKTELDSLLGDLYRPYNEENGGFLSSLWKPLMDISETGKEYVVRVDLPGVPKDDVVVNVDEGQLIISGDRVELKKEEDENYIRVERSTGSFHRRISLPKAVKASEIKAEFNDGELVVHIPKKEESVPRRIKIK